MTAEEYYQEGERLYEAEEYEAAAQAYQKATERDETDARLLKLIHANTHTLMKSGSNWYKAWKT